MRKCRKMISVLVLMAMLATLTPFQALAADTSTEAAPAQATVVEAAQEEEPEAAVTDASAPSEAVAETATEEASASGAAEEKAEAAAEDAAAEVAAAGNTDAAPVEEPDAADTETVAAEIEPEEETVAQEEKAAGGDLLEAADSYLFIVSDGSGNALDKDENGGYTVNPDKNPYEVTLQIEAKKIAEGVYTYQFPDAFTYELSGSPSIVLDGKTIATFEVTENGLLTATFNADSNNAQNITASFSFKVNFSGENHSVHNLGNVPITIDYEYAKDPTLTKGTSGFDKSTGKLNWTIDVVCDPEANAVGTTVVDNIYTDQYKSEHTYHSDDKATGIAVTASNGSDSVTWTLTEGSEGFSWNGDTGWTYTIPASYNGTTFGSDWDFSFACTSTMDVEVTDKLLQFQNNAVIKTGDTEIDGDYEIIDVRSGVGSVSKSGEFDGEDGQKQYANWNFTATVTGLVPTDPVWFKDAMTLYTDGNWDNHFLRLSQDQYPDIDLDSFVVTVTVGDTTETVPVGDGSSTSPSGYYFKVINYSETSRKWESSAPQAEFRLCNKNVDGGSGVTGDLTINASYRVKLTSEYLKIIADNECVRLQNSIWLYKGGEDGYLNFSHKILPLTAPKKVLSTRMDKDTDYIGGFTINYTPTSADLDTLVLEDEMSDTLSYRPGSLKVVAKDNDGNEVAVDFTESYSDHVLTITINDPKVYDYVITYEAVISNSKDDAVNGSIPWSNELSAEVNGESTTAAQTEGKMSNFDASAKKYSVTINKKDENNEPLPGAKFAVYLENGDAQAFGEKTTGDDGTIVYQTSVKDDVIFEVDTPYYIMETDAPEGYKLDQTKHYFVIPANQTWDDSKYTIITTATSTDSSGATTATGSASFDISNEREDIYLTVNKTWDDCNDAEKKRPDQIQVTLMADGSEVVLPTDSEQENPATLTKADGWTYTWQDLPSKTADGQAIVYTVDEVRVDGYKSNVGTPAAVNDDEGNLLGYTVAVENSMTPVTSVSATKEWDDGNDQDKIRPTSIEVQLYAGNDVVVPVTEGEENPVSLTKDNNWTYTWTDLPKYKAVVNGEETTYEEIKYHIVENTDVTGYQKTYSDDGLTVKNTHTDRSVSVRKVDIAGTSEVRGAELQILKGTETVASWTSDGKAHTVKGLTPNTEYTLHEVSAPEGYVLADDITFTVAADGTVNATDVDKNGAILVRNEKTKVGISKTDIADGAELPGATMQILDSTGAEVASWTSTEEVYYIEGLKTGETYTLKETVAPDGYTITSDTTFSIGTDGAVDTEGTVSTDADGVTVLLVEDEMTKITVSKIDTGNGKELPGAQIQIIDKDGNVVEEWTSTNEPHVIEGLLTGVEYILHEKVAPNGYTLTTDTTFTIDEKGNVTSSGTINAEGMLVIEDTLTEVSILKVDAKTGKGLAGAKLQVLDDNGVVCEEWTSTTEAHVVRGLYTGVTYTLREVSAPKGYDKAKDITFSMDAYGKLSSKALKDGKIVMEDTLTPSKSSTTNKTGDSANGALWAMVLVLAGGALAGTVWFRRRRKI